MSICFLIPLIVGVICAILGYLLGKLLAKGKTETGADCEAYKQEIEKLKAELADCQKGHSAPVPVPFDESAAKAAFGKKIKYDDLKIIEGIGPVIEKLFNGHGIKTWKDLAEASVDRCREILHSDPERFAVHDPGTWPKQAELAYNGKWQELKEWQDKLDGGKEV